MVLNINEFIGRINAKPLAKTPHFMAYVTSPSTGLSDELSFRIHSINIPGRQIMSLDFFYYGPIQKVGYNQQFNEITMSVYLSNDYAEKHLLEEWQDLIVGDARKTNSLSIGSFDIGYYDNYKGTITIKQFDDIGNVVYSIELLEAWPFNIGDVQGDWSSDDIIRMPVSFYYRYYIDQEESADTGATGA